jgi:hypothetical protein
LFSLFYAYASTSLLLKARALATELNFPKCFWFLGGVTYDIWPHICILLASSNVEGAVGGCAPVEDIVGDLTSFSFSRRVPGSKRRRTVTLQDDTFEELCRRVRFVIAAPCS